MAQLNYASSEKENDFFFPHFLLMHKASHKLDNQDLSGVAPLTKIIN